jgi:hypothetical protein
MKNPIPKSNMFATPKDEQDLFDRVQQLTAQERQVAMMFVMFTLNLCNQMVEKELQKELTV